MPLQLLFPKQAGIQKVNGHVLFLDLVPASLDPRFRGDGGRESGNDGRKSGMAEERAEAVEKKCEVAEKRMAVEKG